MISTRFSNILTIFHIKFLNNFCQVYLDNILIYSRIKKKYIYYARFILNKLCETDLQIYIKKYKFDIKKIVFLDVIISRTDLRMNSAKIKIIVN